jgi:hypothetical protein
MMRRIFHMGIPSRGAAALAFAAVLASVWVLAQDPVPEPPAPSVTLFDLAGICPPGHRIEFIFGATSLHLDLPWLTPGTLGRVVGQVGPNCPSAPVKGFQLLLSEASWDAAAVPPSLRRPLSVLWIQGFVPRPSRADPVAPRERNPGERPAYPIVEDITAPGSRGASAPEWRRTYALHYPGDRGDSDLSTVVSCQGTITSPARRSCSTPTPFRLFGDIEVRYLIRHDLLPLAAPDQGAPGGPMIEAEGILALDQRVRAWLDAVRRRPEPAPTADQPAAPPDTPEEAGASSGIAPADLRPGIPWETQVHKRVLPLFDLPWCSTWSFRCIRCQKILGRVICVRHRENCEENFGYVECGKFNVPDRCLAWSDGCNTCNRSFGCTAMSCMPWRAEFTCLKSR